MIFDVPLWLEIHNMKSTKQILRNINLSLYNSKKFIGKTVQINCYEKNGMQEFYGENGSYSFLLVGNEIRRFELEFAVWQEDLDGKEFDEVRFSYYDSKDKYREMLIFKIDKPWIISKNEIDSDWRLIN